MSEPTGGEHNPFADIIDLFREVEAANEARAAGPDPIPGSTPKAAPEDAGSTPGDVPAGASEPASPTPQPAIPETAALAVQAPRGGTPVTPKEPSPAPSRRRRAVLLLPVALLALAGGASAAVIHQHRASSATAAPATPTATPTLPSSSPSLPSSSVPATDADTASYSAALDALAGAQGQHNLTEEATTTLPATLTRLQAAGGDLHRAEAAHLASLLALCRLDRLSDYPALVATAAKASAQVERVGAGRDDVPDPTLATDNVVATTAGTVVTRLDGRVAALADSAAHATLTAQLRSIAARATSLVPAATSVASALEGDRASHAAADAAALRALGSLSVIDGDHLGAWATLSTPLQQALTAAGVSAAGADVDAIDTMIAGAQQKLQAWAAAQHAAPNAHPGADSNAGKAAAKKAEAAIDSYVSGASALLDQYGRDIGSLPVVGPGQVPSAALTGRFTTSTGTFSALAGAVGRLHPPTGMGAAQQALAGLVAKAHAAAVAGQAVARSAQSCDSSARSCAFGTQRRWSDYASDLRALGDLGSVRTTLTSTASTAKAAAAAEANATGPTSGSSDAGTNAKGQPKPVV